jgi:hypothetical protein
MSRCGYSQYGRAFCSVKEGDEAYTRTLMLVKKFWDEKPNCHVDSPYGCDHAAEKEGYWTSRGSLYESTHSIQLQDNDNCTKNMLHATYWNQIRPNMEVEIKKYNIDPNDDSSVKITISALALFVLSMLAYF